MWANAGGGNWSSAANWTPSQVPGVSDNAFITNSGNYAVTISADTSVNTVTVGGGSGTQTLALNGGTFTLAGASTIGSQGSLTFSAGTLAGSGDVAISGTLNWSAGIMAGTGRTVLGNGATANFTGSGIKGLNRTLENSGTINYSGTVLTFGYGAAVAGIVNNLSGGVVNVTGEGDFLQSSAAAHAFNNGGTFNKSGAGTTTDFTAVTFNNSATVNVNSGTLNLNSGGSNNGAMGVAAGTTLNFNGAFSHAAGGTVSGAGTVNFPGGTHNFAGQFAPTGAVNLNGATVNFNVAQTFSNLTFSSGTLAGSANVTITGTLNWSAGIMAGTGRTIFGNGATANFTGTGVKGLNRTLDNSGTVAYSGTALTFGYGAAVSGIINNLGDGVFNVTSNGDFAQSSAAAHAFNNSGILNKSGAGTATEFTGVTFNNSGSVNVNTGTLTLNASGSNGGVIALAAGTTLNLVGNFNNLASGSISGAGNIGFPGGTHNIVGPILTTGTVTLSSATVNLSAAQSLANLTFSSGTLQGNGDVTITGAFNWSGGNMGGAGRTILAGGATANFSGANAKGLNRTLDNSGTVTYSGTGLTFGYTVAAAGIINNLPGGVFSVTGEGDFSQSSAAAHAFNNSGTFNKSGAGTTTDFNSVAFNNTNILRITSGTVELSGVTFPSNSVLQSEVGAMLRLPAGNLTGATTNSGAWSTAKN